MYILYRFSAYKLPKLSSSNQIIKDGYGHFYLDGSTSSWTLSDVSLKEDQGHAIAETLKQFYTNNDKVFLLLNVPWLDSLLFLSNHRRDMVG